MKDDQLNDKAGKCKPTINKPIMVLLKFAVSFGSLFIVARKVDWSVLLKLLAHAQYAWAALALGLYWTAQIFSSLRCLYIVHSLGGELEFGTSLRAHFVGLWFNQVLPTGLGGDVVKMAILKDNLGLSVSLRAVILDRISGFIFLLLAIALTLPLYVSIFASHPYYMVFMSILSIGGLLSIASVAYISARTQILKYRHDYLNFLLQIFADIGNFRSGRPLWGQLWTSCIVHFNGILAYALIGVMLGIKVDFITLVLIVPLVFLVALVPISFAGWGVREVGSIWLFGIVGVSRENALAMSIGFGVLMFVVGLPGVFIFIWRSLTTKKITPVIDVH